ncbi:MAG: MMPL family transporter [Pseudomonadales bacterium]|nr:MMPL family transporter [Pseudomonadales bacterium]MCP5184501.1 MMPL family transporter [Pseudomonadales bacterium]
MSSERSQRRLALGSFVLLFILAGVGATRLHVSDDAAEAMLPHSGPAADRYADYLARFPSDEGALVVFDNLLCTDAGWNLIKRVEAAFRAAPSIDRTVSLASPSTRYVIGQGDTVELSRFRDTDFATPQARCEAASNYPPYREVLVSGDGKAAALFLVASGHQSSVDFSTALEDIVQPFRQEATALGGRLIMTGESIISAELSRVVGRDSTLVAGILITMLLLVFIVTRSLATTSTALLLSLFVISVAYGFMGWMAMPLTPATSLVVFLLVPLSGTFVIHAHGYVARQAERQLFPEEGRLPCLFAGLTTAIGFACTGLTPAPDIQSLAIMGVVGIAASTLGVFLLVFPLLHGVKNLRFAVSFSMPRWPLVHPSAGIGMLAVAMVFVVWGLSQLKVDYGPTDYLPMSNSYRADYEAAGQWFGRMNLPLMVEVDDVEDPAPWQALKPLVDLLYEKYPRGFQASWLYDQIAQLNTAITDGDTQAPVFPEDADTLAQLLLWFDPEDLELYMDEDRTRLLINLQIPYLGSGGYFEMKAIVDDYLASHQIKGYYVGRVASFFETGHRIGADNLRGLALGATLVFALLLVIFRSLPYAVIGIVVNALPVLAGLAMLGILGVSVDMGSSVVAAMAFGVVLDDSAHLLVRLRQLQQSGYDAATAVMRSVRELSIPIMTTTFAVCVGFLVLYAAEMRPFHDFATLMISTMLIALFADMLLLPALVRQFMDGDLQRRIRAIRKR